MKLMMLCWALFGGSVWADKESQRRNDLEDFHLPGAVFQETPLKKVIGALAESYQKYSGFGPG